MASLENTRIYLAIRKPDDRSRLEDDLVLDKADVSSFATARELWDLFQTRPVRFIITDQRFGDDFDGLELVRQIRAHYSLPYVYVLMRSIRNQMKDIQVGLKAGVDGYLVKPHNQFQIRSQVLVGLRWLTYIDSVNAVGKADTIRTSPTRGAPASAPR